MKNVLEMAVTPKARACRPLNDIARSRAECPLGQFRVGARWDAMPYVRLREADGMTGNI